MDTSFTDLQDHIRSIPDWPKKGVIFRDITTLMDDRLIFRKMIDAFVYRYLKAEIDVIVAIDARGFIIGAPLAYLLNTSFVPVRKKGKLPYETITQAYSLEYGNAEVEIHTDALKKGDQVLLVDDLIATGGTMLAAANLIQSLGADIIEAAAIIDLPDLGGSKKLRDAGIEVHAFYQFDGD